jgi:hypothetical protein
MPRYIIPLLICVALAILAANGLRKRNTVDSVGEVPGQLAAVQYDTAYSVDQGINSITLYGTDVKTGKTRKIASDKLRGNETSFRYDRMLDGYCYYWVFERPNGPGPFAAGGGGGSFVIQQSIVNLGTFRISESRSAKRDPSEKRTEVEPSVPNPLNRQLYRRFSLQGGAPENVAGEYFRSGQVRVGTTLYYMELGKSREVQVEAGNLRWSEIPSDRRIMVSEAGGKPSLLFTGPALVNTFVGSRIQVVNDRFCWIEPRAYPDSKSDFCMMRAGDEKPIVIADCYPASQPAILNGRFYWLQPVNRDTVIGVGEGGSNLVSVNLDGSDRKIEADLANQSIEASNIVASNNAIYFVYKKAGKEGTGLAQDAPAYLGELVPGGGPPRRLHALHPDVKNGVCDSSFFYYKSRIAQESLADALAAEHRDNFVSMIFRVPLKSK